MSAAVERRARAAVLAATARLAVAVRTQLPRASVTRDGDRVVVRGRGVADEAALRWPAGLLR